MTPGVAIDLPQPGDADAIVALSAQLGYPLERDALLARLRRLLADDTQCVRVARVEGGVVAGWVHAAEQEPLEAGPRAEILGLVVEASRHGRGLGRALVAAVESWARGRGLPLVTLRSNVVRTEAHAFYLHLGFTIEKTQHAFRKRVAPGG